MRESPGGRDKREEGREKGRELLLDYLRARLSQVRHTARAELRFGMRA